jgi:hypothetical protein
MVDTVAHELYECQKEGEHLCEDCAIWLMEQDIEWAEERKWYGK